MAYLEAQYGIDASFVSEVPGYLNCAVCQLVLRNPLQISSCGHKFCTPCFEKLKNYAHNTNTEFVCPVDRKTVDLSRVFEDKSIAMVIGGLPVKCSCSDLGCAWVGELSDLTLHEGKCGYKVNSGSRNIGIEVMEREEMMSLLKTINDRMDHYEGALQDKEKDIAHLKLNIQEMEAKFNREVQRLQGQLNQSEKNMMQYEIKCENLTLKNTSLEQKLQLVENQMFGTNELLQDKEAEIIALKDKVEKLCNYDEDMSTLKAIEQKPVEHNPLEERIAKLEHSLTNLENLSFCDYSNGSKDIVLRWKLQNYQHHADVVGEVCSPVFNTQHNKHRFQLKVKWRKGTGAFGIFLRIHRADTSSTEELKSFNVPYSLELTDEKGKVLSNAVSQADIDRVRNISFTIPSHGPCAQHSHGFSSMVEKSEILNYVINDSMTVVCRLRPL